MTDNHIPWWERRGVLVTLVVVGLIPLLWPALPPLSDLPGHMGRWHISIAIGRSPVLERYYSFRWALIGNLGMDVLVPAVAMLLPFEVATKVAVMLIPTLTMTGIFWLSHEAHGRVTPTAIFALPLAYSWPFQLGFVNFELAQALALCAFALWLLLARRQMLFLRAVLFVPIACGLWLVHSFGWAMFSLMAAGAEIARLRDDRRAWWETLLLAGVQGFPLALPLLFMLHHPSGAGVAAHDWFDWGVKIAWIVSIFRDRWQIADIISLVPILILPYIAWRDPRLGISKLLGWPALFCTAAFVLLPRLMLGGAFVDMRMAPVVAMLGLLSVSPPTGSIKFAKTIALFALAFFLARTAATTGSFILRANEQERELAAISHIPNGAAVLSLIARPCPDAWSDLRADHLPGLAIVRRDVFTNEQWDLQGQQLLRVRYITAAPYLVQPSQLVYPGRCQFNVGSNFAKAIHQFPRAAFTYVWTIGFPPSAVQQPDLTLIWNNGGSALYRVRHR